MFRPVWRQNGCKCWSWWVDFLRILVQGISKQTTPFAKKRWTLALSLTPPLLRIREERGGKKHLEIKFQNLTENFKILGSTKFRLLRLQDNSLQFSQNMSDYSGHSTSKNILWKPLASANRQTYLSVCVAVLKQDCQELDLLFILTFYWHNLYLCLKLYPKLLVSCAACILYWFFFSKWSSPKPLYLCSMAVTSGTGNFHFFAKNDLLRSKERTAV